MHLYETSTKSVFVKLINEVISYPSFTEVTNGSVEVGPSVMVTS